MEVRFGTFAKEINSTKSIDVSSGTTQGFTNIECQLKDNVSFLSPVLLIDDVAYNPNWNYAYIYIWHRFYFVHDAVITTGGIWEVQLALDVLASWKSYIVNMSAYVARSSSHGSLLIEDSTWSHVTDIYTTATTLNLGLDNDGCYILFTASNGMDSSITGTYSGIPGTTAYACTEEQLANVMYYLFSSSFFDSATADITDANSAALSKTFFNPFQYVIKCMWIPLKKTDIPSLLTTIRFGWWEADDGSGTAYTGNLLQAHSIHKTITFNLGTYNDWTDRDPNWTKNDIYIPGIGTMSIPVDYQGQLLTLDYYIDLASGGCGAFIRDNTNNIIVSGSGQLGADIQLSGLYKDLTSNGATGLVGSVAKTIGGAISGYASGLKRMQTQDKSIGGLINSLGTVMHETVKGSQAALQPTASSIGQNGTRAITENEYRAILSTASYNRLSNNTQYLGAVCNKILSLSALSGYTEIVNPKADIPCTSEETQMINGFLSGGFYLE